MAQVRPTPISARQLTFAVDDGRYVADASDLPPASRIFDDAADEGYTLTHSDGREYVLTLAGTFRDKEGEVVFWDFVPLVATGRPALRVFND